MCVSLCAYLFGWRSDQLCMKKKNTKENKDKENREGDAGLGYFQAL